MDGGSKGIREGKEKGEGEEDGLSGSNCRTCRLLSASMAMM